MLEQRDNGLDAETKPTGELQLSNAVLENSSGAFVRLMSLFSIVLVGFYVLGALGSSSINPQTVANFLYGEIPALFDYQLNLIKSSFANYHLLGIIASAAFLMTAGAAVCLMIFEILYFGVRYRSLQKSWLESSVYRLIFGEKSERTDLYMYLYYCFSFDRFVVAGLGLLGPFFIFGLIINGANVGLATDWHPALKFLAFLLISDFLGYWFHRIAHTTPSLWELHKFHHGATSMNFITAHRNHPFEVALQLPLKAIPIAILGPEIHHYIGYVVIHHFVILLQHSNFNITFGVLERVFVSPRFHLVHHSMKPEHFDKNFGVVFSFWDDLFSSRYKGSDSIPAYGVTANYFNTKSIFNDLIVPFQKFCQGMIKKSRID